MAAWATHAAIEPALIGLWALTLGAFVLAGGLPSGGDAGGSLAPRAWSLQRGLLVLNFITLLAMLARSALLVLDGGRDAGGGISRSGAAHLIGATALPLGLFWPFGTLGIAMAGPALAVAGLARFNYWSWLKPLLLVAVVDGLAWAGLLARLANKPFDYVFVATLAVLALGTGLLALRIGPAIADPAGATQ